MISKAFRISSFMALLALAGCAEVSFAPAHVPYSVSRPYSANDVKVFRTEKPQGEFEELGTVSVTGTADLNKASRLLREEAARKGGNAIIDLTVRPEGASGTVIRIK